MSNISPHHTRPRGVWNANPLWRFLEVANPARESSSPGVPILHLRHPGYGISAVPYDFAAPTKMDESQRRSLAVLSATRKGTRLAHDSSKSAFPQDPDW